MRSGGSERTVAYLSTAMAEKGHNVTILSLSNDLFYELSPKVNFVVVKQPKHRVFWADRYFQAYSRYKHINNYVKKQKPDVVFCMLSDIAKYILRLHKRGVFTLVTSERANPQFVSSPKVWDRLKNIYKQSDGIIFQTDRVMENFDEDIRKKGVVIQNAVGNILAYSVVATQVKRKAIAAMGRLDKQKDYPTLIDAFAKICKEYPEYSLEIYGEGSQKNELKSYVDDKHLSDKVHFMGAHADALSRISDVSCFVMSSTFEGMPNALMEAMAIGLPCVSTDCLYGPAELLTDGYNGLLVPVGDSNSLYDAIKKMIDDVDFAKKCGQNAREILRTNSIEEIANRYISYIEKVVSKRVN